MSVRMILAAATIAVAATAGPAACATTAHPAAPTSTTAKAPAGGKPVATTKKPASPPKTTAPAPAPKTTPSRQLHYTAPTNVAVQTMCDDNGNAYDIHPNTAPARERAAEMCNNLQVGLDRAGFSH